MRKPLPFTRALPADQVISFSLSDPDADIRADTISPAPDGIGFTVISPDSAPLPVTISMPGRHNVANALAALAAAHAIGVPLDQACAALSEFQGIKRRMEFVGDSGRGYRYRRLRA